MKSGKMLVTSYENPDLDGAACSMAYAEFLQKLGSDAVCGIFGNLHAETLFVFQTFQIEPPLHAEDIINGSYNIVLTDASDTTGISSQVNPKQVIEIIDHRKLNKASKFPHAKVQIELVGSAATLIAEKFHANNTEISKASAVLLYSAIISNTVNFLADVTTDRDRKMVEWLTNKFQLPQNYIHSMFAYKSTFNDPLKEVLLHDAAFWEFSGLKLCILQLEIIDVDMFFEKRASEISAVIQQIKENRAQDLIFLTVVDVEKGMNTFFTIDNESEKIVEKALQVEFRDHIAKRDGVIMRKSIIPQVKEVIEARNKNSALSS
jgi:inorganic pyrophosphatase/exopolyphosphatase